MSDTIKRTIEWAIRQKNNSLPASNEIPPEGELGITRAEGEVFARIESQLTAERDEYKAECERLMGLLQDAVRAGNQIADQRDFLEGKTC